MAEHSVKTTGSYRLIKEIQRKGYPYVTYSIVLETTTQVLVDGIPAGDPQYDIKPMIVALSGKQACDLAGNIMDVTGDA